MPDEMKKRFFNPWPSRHPFAILPDLNRPDKNLTKLLGLIKAGKGKIFLPVDIIYIFIIFVFGLIFANFSLGVGILEKNRLAQRWIAKAS